MASTATSSNYLPLSPSMSLSPPSPLSSSSSSPSANTCPLVRGQLHMYISPAATPLNSAMFLSSSLFSKRTTLRTPLALQLILLLVLSPVMVLFTLPDDLSTSVLLVPSIRLALEASSSYRGILNASSGDLLLIMMSKRCEM
jgi:hypothetical protein